MVQRASSETPSLSGNNRESSRMNLGIGYTAYQGGYNKLFTQVCLSSITYPASIYRHYSIANTVCTFVKSIGNIERINCFKHSYLS